MVNETSVDILFISLLVLFVILVVLVVLFWIYRHFKNRDLTLMKISVGQPPLQLAIRTQPEHAQELMDHLLQRFALQAETVTDIEEAAQEHGEENAAASTVASDFSKIPNILSKKVSQWLSVALPSRQSSKQQRTPSIHSVCTENQDEAHPASSSQAATHSGKSNKKRREEETIL